ncbi:glutamate--cysteine ligase [Anaerococcus sp. mt242]|uniref:glutamate-cysteine ligase family protein n=1 Tax=Anaerococcus sp. mt242 TaxID=2661917 RepID=UPI001932E230|nr:glutamate-cysteine ligase family protein [Anaerococcus sp. mt242]MBM0046091.1 glutamate--cysteine ligase [Anaerococcus sp. mt242]
MNYDKKIDAIVDYIKSGEKSVEDFKVGFEVEHFPINAETMETITYGEKGGVRDSLTEIEKLGYEGVYEGENIMGISASDFAISIEPAAQFEVAYGAKKTVDELFDNYKKVMGQIVPIFDKKNQLLAQVGYQPKSKIDDLPFIPKERYKYMAQYFKDFGGSSPFNMMKGSGSLQVAIDYKDEADFKKKFFVANAVSIFLYSTFDNAYIFEGEVYPKHNLRQSIWDNCDKNRSGIYDFAFDSDLSYEKYAAKILATDSIFIHKDGKDIYTGNTPFEEIFDNEDMSLDMINHALSIVFPDVRVKTYIEVRMPDNVPYPYNFAAVALIKNMFYDEEILQFLSQLFADMTYERSQKLKDKALMQGIDTIYKDKKISEWMLEITQMIKEDSEYIKPLEDLLKKDQTPRDIYESLYKEDPQKAIYNYSVNKFIKEN